MKTALARSICAAFLAATVPAAFGANPATLSNNTRYLAMGDSLTAGYGAMPATDGYAYLLYREGGASRTFRFRPSRRSRRSTRSWRACLPR